MGTSLVSNTKRASLGLRNTARGNDKRHFCLGNNALGASMIDVVCGGNRANINPKVIDLPDLIEHRRRKHGWRVFVLPEAFVRLAQLQDQGVVACLEKRQLIDERLHAGRPLSLSDLNISHELLRESLLG